MPSAKDAKVLLEMSGDPAKRMFEHLGTKSELRECVSSGEHARSRGDLTCTRDAAGKFACAIGIDLNTGKSIAGSIC